MESSNSDLISVSSELDEQFNFKCRFCHKNLSSRQNLKEHTYIHTGERPYVCDKEGCGQTFRQGSLFSIHKRIHLEVKNGIMKETLKKKKICIRLSQLLRPEENHFHIPLDEENRRKIIQELQDDYFFIASFLS